MTRFPERLILSWGFTCWLAAGASAQIVVQGVVQPDESPGLKPDEVLRTERPATLPWSVTLGVHEALESNVEGTPGGDQDVGSLLDAAMTRNWTGQRGDVRVFGNLAENIYRKTTSLNQFLYGVGAGTSYKVSRRMLWDVSDTLTSSYAQDATVLSDSGLLPPKLLTHVNTASSALRYDLSSTTQIRWLLSEQTVSFDSSQLASAPASQFGASSTLTTGVNVGRQLSRSQTLGVTEEYRRTNTFGETEITDALLVTWQDAVSKDITVTGTAGTSLYTQPGQSGFGSAPTGSIGFNAHLRHDDMLGLRYERFVEQALGNLTHLSDQVWAAYVLSLSRRLKLDASANYGRGIFPLDPNHKRSGETATITARYVLTQDLTVALGYALAERFESPGPEVSDRRATMSLTYGLKWR
jgi:hypothetical protein